MSAARSRRCSPAANLYVDVESYPSFSSVTINSQIDGSKNFINNMQYNPGGPGDIVVVRLFYPWPLFVTGLGYNISNLSGQPAVAGRHRRLSQRALLGQSDEIDVEDCGGVRDAPSMAC